MGRKGKKKKKINYFSQESETTRGGGQRNISNAKKLRLYVAYHREKEKKNNTLAKNPEAPPGGARNISMQKLRPHVDYQVSPGEKNRGLVFISGLQTTTNKFSYYPRSHVDYHREREKYILPPPGGG